MSERRRFAGRVRYGPEIFRIQSRGGVSRYVVELHRGLLARGVDSRIVAGLHRSEVLAGVPQVVGARMPDLPWDRARQAITKAADEPLATLAPRRLGPGNIWQPSYFPRRLPSRGSGPSFVVTVHDMIHERFPDGVSPRDDTVARKAAAVRAADLVLCNSQDTADDLVDRLGIDRDRVVVTPLGVRPVPAEHRPSPAGGAPYLVYVGERAAPHKNWPTLLDALAESDPVLHLVCVGPPFDGIEREALARRGLAGRVHAEAATDAQLAGRLADAAGLVYPSRYEGFGLPPLEALAQGCPVVAAATGAIPEVVGDVAIMVAPTVEGVGDGIARLLAGGPEVVRQRREGPAFAAGWSWDRTVERTLEAYEALART